MDYESIDFNSLEIKASVAERWKNKDMAAKARQAYHDANVRLMQELEERKRNKSKARQQVAFVARVDVEPTYTREQKIDDLVAMANKYYS